MRTPGTSGMALAPAMWPGAVHPAIRAVALIVIGSILLTISAKVRVPFWPVPMTLQTFAVMALAAAYGARLGTATVVFYLLQGLAGLPVFTNPGAGPAYFLGTTGGFLVGFIAAAWVVGSAADRGWDRSPLRLAAAMVVADAVVFALGFAWLAWFTTLSPGLVSLLGVAEGSRGTGIAFAWVNGVQNFLLGDTVKIALAAALVPAGWRLLERRAP